MSRWAELTGGNAGANYDDRWQRLAETGADVHGEARFCANLVAPGGRVLDAGCGTGRVARRLTELGYDCVGVDLDPSMLDVARRAAPEQTWIEADLTSLDLPSHGVTDPFDLVVAAGNIIPLVAAGTEPAVIARMAAHLRPGGLLVTGFGLDAAHLPLPEATVTTADYDGWCAEAGLRLEQRFATWDADPFPTQAATPDGADPGTHGGGAVDAGPAGYAVNVHRRA